MDKKRSKELSIEFFPPKTPEGAEKLRLVKDRLAKEVKPSFFSVTFGAGGSTQEGTLRTVESIHQSGQEAAPHLSCVGSSKENIYELLRLYKEMGVRRNYYPLAAFKREDAVVMNLPLSAEPPSPSPPSPPSKPP